MKDASLRRTLLALVLGALVAPAVATAQVAPPDVLNWSQPSSWPNNQVPGNGVCVLIPAGTNYMLDVSTSNLGGLDIQGSLTLDGASHDITSDWIRIGGNGSLDIGTTTSPYPGRVRIHLTDNFNCNTAMERRTLSVEGAGTLSLHGLPLSPSWTRLSSPGHVNDPAIQLLVAPAWRVGDEIVIASTDFDSDQTEYRSVRSTPTTSLTLGVYPPPAQPTQPAAQPLTNLHWGAFEGAGIDPYGPGVEERAEVGLLTRSITIDGPTTGANLGGHTIVHNTTGFGPTFNVEWVEFRNLGKPATPDRYPIYFDGLGNTHGLLSVKNCSVHHSFNRSVGISGTNSVTLENNTVCDTLGHSIYFEDGTETSCVLRGNLVLLTRGTTAGLPDDVNPAAFYLGSPTNVIENNVAGGSKGPSSYPNFDARGYGFYFNTPTGPAAPWTLFRGNVAHSNGASGFFNEFTRPMPTSEWLLENLTSYKNRAYGLWTHVRGDVRVRGFHAADNRGALYFGTEGLFFERPRDWPSTNLTGLGVATLENSFIVGESLNIGQPTACDEQAALRSLPQRYPYTDPFNNLMSTAHVPRWSAITGVDLYDGTILVHDTRFYGFVDRTWQGCNGSGSQLLKEAAFHQVYKENPWAVDPRNAVGANVSFVITQIKCGSATREVTGVRVRAPMVSQSRTTESPAPCLWTHLDY